MPLTLRLLVADANPADRSFIERLLRTVLPAVEGESISDEEDSYRDLFENASDAIATFTWDGIITNVNRGAELLLGWSREEMIGQYVSKVATPAAVALAEERARRFLAGRKLPPVFEAELIRKDGSLVTVDVRT